MGEDIEESPLSTNISCLTALETDFPSHQFFPAPLSAQLLGQSPFGYARLDLRTALANARASDTLDCVMAFWRRKKDEFVSLGLNQPSAAQPAPEPAAAPEPKPPAETSKPAPIEPNKNSNATPWQTSVLGLDLSIEQLQAREAALEQEFSARFRRAVAATRESLSERIDTVFAGAKRIDAELLDELEEALIAADIGVPTTMHVLDTVRRGVSRKEIDDIEKLKGAIKSELLSILKGAEQQGVASETNVPENIGPYVMMIVG